MAKGSGKRSLSASFLVLLGKFGPWVVAVGGMFLLIVVMSGLVKSKSKEIEDERKAVTGAKAEIINVVARKLHGREMVDVIKLPGLVQPWEELTLQAQVSGQVQPPQISGAKGNVLVDEGTEVKAGQLLACIDERDYKTALDEAKATLTLCQAMVERARNLYGQSVMPKKDLDDAEAAFAKAKASTEQAEINLSRCAIISPINGIINKRHITTGQLVNNGTALFDIVDSLRVKVDIGIPESDISKVRGLAEAKITVEALGGKELTGKNIFLSEKPMDQARAYTLRLAIDNANRELKPGMMVDALVERERKKDAILVPLFAVLNDGDTHYCYAVKDGKAAKRELKTGRMLYREMEVLSGLSDGEELIIMGQRQVENGTPVAVAYEKDGQAAPAATTSQK